MTFETTLEARPASEYADFLIPHLSPTARVLDVGCGEGTIAIGLADVAGHVVGVDLDQDAFADARRYAHKHGLENIDFRVGSVYSLGRSGDRFDACLCHSVLEALDRPLNALRAIKRVLEPGGVLGAASVEYGGLILAGPNEPLLRRFYAIRERLWQLEAGADPYRGRALRGLLEAAGFERVVASAKYFSYGTREAVHTFGTARAADCRDDWYASRAQSHGLATARDLEVIEDAWLTWSESSEAYAAFAWCRALGFKPNAATTE
jgi:ubiquinone/menaquinone biosynthesis C-methylase UbiE